VLDSVGLEREDAAHCVNRGVEIREGPALAPVKDPAKECAHLLVEPGGVYTSPLPSLDP
jgi:hypothetical protein